MSKQKLRAEILSRLEQISTEGSSKAARAAADVLADAGNIENDLERAALAVLDSGWSVEDVVRSTWLTSDTLDEDWAIAEQNKLNAKYLLSKWMEKNPRHELRNMVKPIRFNRMVQSSGDATTHMIQGATTHMTQGTDTMKDILVAAIHYTIQLAIDNSPGEVLRVTQLRELERRLVDKIASETQLDVALSSYDLQKTIQALQKAARIHSEV